MGGLMNQFGIGVLLSWKDQMSKGADTAARSLEGLRKTARTTAGDIEKQAEIASRHMQRMRSGMFTSGAIAAAGVGMVMPFVKAVEASATFEDKLNDIKTLWAAEGKSQTEINQLTDEFRNKMFDIGSRVPKGIDEIADAYYRLRSSLGDVVSLAGGEEVVKLATVGRASVSEAVDASTSLFKVYKNLMSGTDQEKMTKATTALAFSVASANTTLPELGMGLKYVMGQAAGAGLAMNDLVLSVAMAQDVGLKGERAGSGLAAWLREVINLQNGVKGLKQKGNASLNEVLLSPFKVSGSAQKNPYLQALANMKIADAQGNLLPITQLLRNIGVALGIDAAKAKTVAEEINRVGAEGEAADEIIKKHLGVQQLSAMQQAFGDEGARFPLMMLSQIDIIEERLKRVNSNANLLSEMAAQKAGGTASKWQIFQNSLLRLKDTISNGLAPTLTKLMDSLGKIAGALSEFAKNHPDVTKWVAFGTTAAGSILAVTGALGMAMFGTRMFWTTVVGMWSVVSPIMFALGNTVMVLRARLALLAAAQWLWNAAINANPLVLLATGIAAVLFAGYKLGRWLARESQGNSENMFDAATKAKDALAQWGQRKTDIGMGIGEGFSASVDPTLGVEGGSKFGSAAAQAMLREQERQKNLREGVNSAVMRQTQGVVNRHTFWKDLLYTWPDMLGLTDQLSPRLREPQTGMPFAPGVLAERQRLATRGETPKLDLSQFGPSTDYSTRRYNVTVVASPSPKDTAKAVVKEIERKEKAGKNGRR